MELIEELAATNLLLRGLDIIAKSDCINLLIIKSIEVHNENKSKKNVKNIDEKHVQILRHWCQMNGQIFKSVWEKFV